MAAGPALFILAAGPAIAIGILVTAGATSMVLGISLPGVLASFLCYRDQKTDGHHPSRPRATPQRWTSEPYGPEGGYIPFTESPPSVAAPSRGGHMEAKAAGRTSALKASCMDAVAGHLPEAAAPATITPDSRKRLQELVAGQMIVPAFQPIVDLSTGNLVGVEALSRFITDEGSGAEYWFHEAAALGMSADLELAAIKAALDAAEELPHVYLALNISPAACLEAGLASLLMNSSIPLERIVLELTERDPVEDYDLLNEELAPLRQKGVRIAIDDTGAGFSSMRHILKIHPDIIKLDRSLISGIHENPGQRALGTAMVAFAEEIGASIVAEGIETPSELHCVTLLGMNSRARLPPRPAHGPHL